MTIKKKFQTKSQRKLKLSEIRSIRTLADKAIKHLKLNRKSFVAARSELEAELEKLREKNKPTIDDFVVPYFLGRKLTFSETMFEIAKTAREGSKRDRQFFERALKRRPEWTRPFCC